MSRLGRWGAIAASVWLASSISIQVPIDAEGKLLLDFDSNAVAKSSGGRSRGGSFRSSPSRSSGSSRSSGGSSYSSPRRSNSNRSPSWEYTPYQQPRSSYGRGPVIIPVPAGPSVYNDPGWGNNRSSSDRAPATNTPSTTGNDNWIAGLLFLGVAGVVVFVLAYMAIRAVRGSAGGGLAASELANDTVTVSKVQVALLAQARYIQVELTKLSLEVDTSTSEGLLQLLQESALALLRSPENWSHVLTSSETVRDLTAAEALFNRLSIEQRSKFSVETLTNVGGKISRKAFQPDPDEDPASYIVVTLLVGTAHDTPLVEAVRTTAALQDVLQKLASMPAEYLMVFELLWTPQEATDSLTYDELLTGYPDMIQL